eukprot:1187008-Prorocentrum_minimum.AAC.5
MSSCQINYDTAPHPVVQAHFEQHPHTPRRRIEIICQVIKIRQFGPIGPSGGIRDIIAPC